MPRIYLACPNCENEQLEPLAVISTICRSCGSHLVAEKCSSRPEREGFLSGLAARIFHRRTPQEPRTPKPAVLAPTTRRTPAATPGIPVSGSNPSTGLPKKKTGLVAVPPPSGFQRSRHSRELFCFQCRENYLAPRLAPQTSCPACAAVYRSDDVRIEDTCVGDLLTHGNIIVGRNGIFKGRRLGCHMLAAFGQVSGDVLVTGRAELHSCCELDGVFECRDLVISRRARVRGTNPVIAKRTIHIDGRFEGELFAGDAVVLSAGAELHGRVVARHVEIHPDCVFEAEMMISPNPITEAHNRIAANE